MYRIAICDDVEEICSQIEKVLTESGEKLDVDFTANKYYSGDELI